jgi:hypothetical protein
MITGCNLGKYVVSRPFTPFTISLTIRRCSEGKPVGYLRKKGLFTTE